MKLYWRLKVNNKWTYRAVTVEEYNKMLDDSNEL